MARIPLTDHASEGVLLGLVHADLAPPGRVDPVLRDVSFRIVRGEVVVLLGANGSGKTTLLRSLAGLWPLRAGHRSPPQPDGFDARRTGLLLEDPSSQFTAATVEGEIAFGLENQGYSPAEIASRTNGLLEALALTEMASVDPRHLSPGEQELALVAAALAPGPPVLLLDDPFLYLGPADARRAWKQLVRSVRTGLIGALCLAGHDPEPARLADRWAILAEGGVSRQGTPGIEGVPVAP